MIKATFLSALFFKLDRMKSNLKKGALKDTCKLPKSLIKLFRNQPESVPYDRSVRRLVTFVMLYE